MFAASRSWATPACPLRVVVCLALLLWANATDLNRPYRRLQQSSSQFCPDGCSENGCVSAGTPGGLRCNKCLNNLVVDTISGGCACPAGAYATTGTSCADCTKGSWCPGGIYNSNNLSTAPRVPCGLQMTTLGRRAGSQRSCVNLPGYSYSLDASNSPTAVPYPAGTYSPGLKKQRACVPCPTGFTTNGTTKATSPTACVIPPGSYLKAPGQAALCPRGEYKSDWSQAGNCTKCAFGVTTVNEGSTAESDCTVLVPGMFAVSMSGTGAITAAALCPQSYYCPGGKPAQTFNTSNPSALAANETTIVPCPDQLWTQELGSTAAQQCLTPPGYYTAAGKTLRCSTGSFRADWKPAAEASSCASCGVGVQSESSDRVTRYTLVGNTAIQVPITTSSDDCFILPGQGLYYTTLTKSWRAVNCNSSSYGVANLTYGLTSAACRDCPVGTLTNSNILASSQYLTANGYTSVLACVTKPGYGFSGRGAQKCDKGSYNPGGNLDACKTCPFGTTTTGVGVGNTVADCLVAPGFGYVEGALAQCPFGTYNDAINANATAPCQSCPTGTTTDAAGRDSLSDCKFCAAGYGGTDCATLCGGVGEGSTYGPAGRALSAQCLSCSSQGKTIGFSFEWNMENDMFVARTVSRTGASSSTDCLSEYTQLLDGAWYLPVSSSYGVSSTSNVTSFAACVDLCSTAACQFVTYDYRAKTCTQRMTTPPIMEGAPFIAFKTVLSGATGTSPWSRVHTGNASTKAVAAGSYVYYQEPYALDVGVQSPPPNAASFSSVQDCSNACDDDLDCAGFTIQMTVAQAAVGTTCQLVRGITKLGQFKRTVVRTDLNRLAMPVFLCPSGYTAVPGLVNCVPITTAQAAVFVLTAQGTCDAATIQSVKDAITNYLRNPYTAFGVYMPKLQVKVNCLSSVNAQVFAGRRHLLQNDDSTRIAMTVVVTYLGTGVGSGAVYADVEAAQCSIPGLCSRLNGTSLKRGWLGAGAVVGGQLELTAQGDETSVVVTAVYKENGTVVSMPTFFSGPTDSNSGLSCTYGRDGLAQLYTCNTSTAIRNVHFSAVAPNPLDPDTPLKTSIQTPYLTCSDKIINTMAGNVSDYGVEDGGDGVPAISTRLSEIRTIALDLDDNLLVADSFMKIFKVDQTTGIMTWVAGVGQQAVRRRLLTSHPAPTRQQVNTRPGSKLMDIFRQPMAFSPAAGVKPAATSATRLHTSKSTMNKASTTSTPVAHAAASDIAAILGENVPAREANIAPAKMVVDSKGNIIFVDYSNCVRKIDAQTGNITTYAGQLGSSPSFDGCLPSGDGGLAPDAMLCFPSAIAIHPTSGDVFIAELGQCRIRKVDAATNIISTWFSAPCDITDGVYPPFFAMYSLAVDGAGNVLLLDENADSITLRKIDAVTRVASVVAGGIPVPDPFAPNGDGGPAASALLFRSSDVVVDRTYGHIYVSEQGVERGGRVRKINVQTGIITTVVGVAPTADGDLPPLGDGGPVTLAALRYPLALVMGRDGALYVGDGEPWLPDGSRIRKVTC